MANKPMNAEKGKRLKRRVRPDQGMSSSTFVKAKPMSKSRLNRAKHRGAEKY